MRPHTAVLLTYSPTAVLTYLLTHYITYLLTELPNLATRLLTCLLTYMHTYLLLERYVALILDGIIPCPEACCKLAVKLSSADSSIFYKSRFFESSVLGVLREYQCSPARWVPPFIACARIHRTQYNHLTTAQALRHLLPTCQHPLRSCKEICYHADVSTHSDGWHTKPTTTVAGYRRSQPKCGHPRFRSLDNETLRCVQVYACS